MALEGSQRLQGNGQRTAEVVVLPPFLRGGGAPSSGHLNGAVIYGHLGSRAQKKCRGLI